MSRIGRYELIEQLGRGVSGTVYLAHDTVLRRQVALKVLEAAGNVQELLEEARILDRLRHPNIVALLNADDYEGQAIIAMEYVTGRTLAAVLRVEARLSLYPAVKIAIRILDALQYAHGRDVAHHDIKPSNIHVGRKGTVTVFDWGIARSMSSNAGRAGGTYPYMSPESFTEASGTDIQSDLWSVGVILYKMVGGMRPFRTAHPADPLAWKRTLETEDPPMLINLVQDIPLRLQGIMDRALAKNRFRRYQSAGAFRDDLVALKAKPCASAPLQATHRVFHSAPSKGTV